MVFVFGRGSIIQVVILELGTVHVWISGLFFYENGVTLMLWLVGEIS